jgi:hypothetical protein
MYLAPLNYDRFFKKVFSDLSISKRFLEDFLDTTIEQIEYLPSYTKITDDATAVEFDFRCKIEGRYVIVDMQQWFKSDVVKRFYLYHTLNTALQMEAIPEKNLLKDDDENVTKTTKDYNRIAPAITLIWMADDNLGFDQNFIAYALAPESVVEFIKDHEHWQKENFLQLLQYRETLLEQLNNSTKQLNFLPKNRLIYLFQKNIVANANDKLNKYVAWFELAEKTKNKDNTIEDFMVFKSDPILSEVMRRINKTTLTTEDFQYIEDYERFEAGFRRHEESIRSVAKEEFFELGMEAGKELGVEIGKELGVEIGKELGVEIGRELGQTIAAKNCLLAGMTPEQAASVSGLPIIKVEAIAKALSL